MTSAGNKAGERDRGGQAVEHPAQCPARSGCPAERTRSAAQAGTGAPRQCWPPAARIELVLCSLGCLTCTRGVPKSKHEDLPAATWFQG